MCGKDDDRTASESGCEYFTNVRGYIELYQIGGYLGRHRSGYEKYAEYFCQNERNSGEEIHRRSIHPIVLSRVVYSGAQTKNMNKQED